MDNHLVADDSFSVRELNQQLIGIARQARERQIMPLSRYYALLPAAGGLTVLHGSDSYQGVRWMCGEDSYSFIVKPTTVELSGNNQSPFGVKQLQLFSEQLKRGVSLVPAEYSLYGYVERGEVVGLYASRGVNETNAPLLPGLKLCGVNIFTALPNTFDWARRWDLKKAYDFYAKFWQEVRKGRVVPIAHRAEKLFRNGARYLCDGNGERVEFPQLDGQRPKVVTGQPYRLIDTKTGRPSSVTKYQFCNTGTATFH